MTMCDDVLLLLPLLLLVITTSILIRAKLLSHIRQRQMNPFLAMPIGQRALASQAQQSYEALKCTVVSMPNSPQAAVTGRLYHEMMTCHDPWVSVRLQRAKERPVYPRALPMPGAW